MIINHPIYRPLYENKDKFIILITGGRGSGKSYAASAFIERLTFEKTPEQIIHQILYTRYTMVSAAISVIPEVMEKIETDGTARYFHSTRSDIVNKMTGSRIMFRGIRSSSGNQTAKLKSIHGITTFVVDEAEEWTSEREFDTIMLSIRQTGIQNRIIIIMNPTDSNHFIYQRYIKDTHEDRIIDGVPVQISTHPNVLHIHTTYFDNLKNLSTQFLDEVKAMKENNPEKYAHVVMGRWTDVAEGAVFKKWGIVDEFPKYAKKVALGLDFGYSCFRGDTLITTDKGDVPIKDIKAGDYVLTRKGFRRVLNVLYNGKKKVVEKEIVTPLRTATFFATEEHNFNANGKWKKYGELDVTDRMFVLSSLMGTNIADTPTENTQTITTVTGSERNACIMQCMSTILEKFLRGMSYITETIIRSTTTSATSLLSPLKNITSSIQRSRKCLGQTAGQGKCVIQSQIGESDAKKLMRSWHQSDGYAKTAGLNTLQQTLINGFAQANVTTSGNIMQCRTSKSESVNGVDNCIGGINILNQNVVPTPAHINSATITGITTKGTGYADVYDLEIEDVHEYFANGFLVHNCDPSSCVRCGIVGNDLYIDEVFYKTGMLVSDLIKGLKTEDNLFVYADSADPRLIDEIALGGIVIYPVQKGAGSIIAGIEKIKDFDNIFVTRQSYNVQHELRNYVWARDKNGNYINSPEDHDNHCFVGDTLITTDNGEKPIKDIKEGDVVLTSAGYKKVERKFDNGRRKVWTVRLHFGDYNVEMTVTPNHKIKTEKGWQTIEELTKQSTLPKLYLCKYLTAKSIVSIGGNAISQEDAKGYIESYGSSTMGQFHKAGTSTTKTATLGTTPLKTSNVSKEANICITMQKYTSKMKRLWQELEQIWTKHVWKPASGTHQQRDASGTVYTGKRSQNISFLKVTCVNGAGKNISVNPMAQTVSAPTIANQHTEKAHGATKSYTSASVAENSFIPTNTDQQNTAPSPVCISAEQLQGIEIISKDIEFVYDLQVADIHEYFANKVLVHNCIDATRYFINGHILGQIIRKRDNALDIRNVGLF